MTNLLVSQFVNSNLLALPLFEKKSFMHFSVECNVKLSFIDKLE